MTANYIAARCDGQVLTLTLSRPEKRNAIDLAMLDELIRQIQRFARDPELRVLHLSAAGDTFSAGGDFAGGLFPDTSHASAAQFREWLQHGPASLAALGDLIASIQKPTVVSHQGACIGGALELSLACDFRLASERASYALPEMAFGITPSGGGIVRLTKLVGPQWARWLHIAGQVVPARKAESIGLVHAVYAAEDLDREAQVLCQKIASLPTEASTAAKLTINLCSEVGEAIGRDIERLAASSLVFGTEYQEEVAKLRARFAAGR